jgi:hypothetical protein
MPSVPAPIRCAALSPTSPTPPSPAPPSAPPRQACAQQRGRVMLTRVMLTTIPTARASGQSPPRPRAGLALHQVPVVAAAFLRLHVGQLGPEKMRSLLERQPQRGNGADAGGINAHPSRPVRTHQQSSSRMPAWKVIRQSQSGQTRCSRWQDFCLQRRRTSGISGSFRGGLGWWGVSELHRLRQTSPDSLLRTQDEALYTRGPCGQHHGGFRSRRAGVWHSDARVLCPRRRPRGAGSALALTDGPAALSPSPRGPRRQRRSSTFPPYSWPSAARLEQVGRWSGGC